MIGFLFAFLAVFGAFLFLSRGGNGGSSSSPSIMYNSDRSSQCNGDTCSLR